VTTVFTQRPELHVSMVHGLASLQSAVWVQDWQPAIGTFEHPVVVEQLSVVQALLSLQLRAVPALHTPLRQVSLPLQTLPSPHGVPLRTGVARHPNAGSQLSFVHGLLSLQTSVVPAVQTAFWHVSAPLQTLPSLHAVPLVTPVFVHPVAGVQASVVQALLSLQLRAVPAVQTPP
jgi:hypothetical protein